LNPSSADASLDDPTLRRMIGFSRAAGFAGLEVVNLFAWRATEPRELVRAAMERDVVGLRNDEAIDTAARLSAVLVAAWGAVPTGLRKMHQTDRLRFRHRHVLSQLLEHGKPVLCLGHTLAGWPRHPLYVPNGRRLVAFAR
jgi:hypothetical protein